MSFNSTVQHFRAFADINHADETPLQSNYMVQRQLKIDSSAWDNNHCDNSANSANSASDETF